MNQKTRLAAIAACLVSFALNGCKDREVSRQPVVTDAGATADANHTPAPTPDAGTVAQDGGPKPPSCMSCQPGTACVMLPPIGNVTGGIICVPMPQLPTPPVIVPADAGPADVQDASADAEDAADVPADTNSQPDSGPVVPTVGTCQVCVAAGMACVPMPTGNVACVPLSALPLPPVVPPAPVPVVPNTPDAGAPQDSGTVDVPAPEGPAHVTALDVANVIRGNGSEITEARIAAARLFCRVESEALQNAIDSGNKEPCAVGTTVGCFRRELSVALATCDANDAPYGCRHPARNNVPQWANACAQVSGVPNALVFQCLPGQTCTPQAVAHALHPEFVPAQ